MAVGPGASRRRGVSVPSPGRRGVLRAAAALAVVAIAGAAAAPRARAQPRFTAYPFALGVASGYPRPDSVVLWTRLAPQPLAGDGGMPPESVDLSWEVARDEGFRDIARKGTLGAYPALAHSVRAEVRGLEPGRWYWYRFRAGSETSPTGRTRTAPAADEAAPRLRFAFASCQQYEQGWYGAYRHMAEEDLDLVAFLGDYVYESSWGREHVRRHAGGEPRTLAEYRVRHAQYRADADLQRMHALAPWILTWDDHEVENDYAGEASQHLDPAFLQRRAAAYQAYYEHMPLPRSALPRGPDLRLYDRVEWGALARFHLLDDRQYRSPQACPRPGRGGSNTLAGCEERVAAGRTLLGEAQERWLLEGAAAPGARWNVIAQQTLMAQAARGTGPERRFWTDGWDGYPLDRRRILEALRDRRAANPVVIGGDVHTYYVSDLKPDFDDPASPVVAAEFCGTSITSQSFAQSTVDAIVAANPHMRLGHAAKRGYVRVEVTPSRCAVALRAVDDVRERLPEISTLARFAVEDGRPGVQPD